ncbi:Rossmann-like and DUF2520 domain-containing protein [Sphingobacterium sp. BIGb0165]|uniref:Rossmann-like and DUF2520 domain-containing protein n=1 Tax=Sphingobacterium sp. BIGb0165 TaxID=2940615 RepID=UPI002167A322|nr:Rossmann-like and DUF2520 domain-containing protein [Sphingobacterium sp. BIGb0165]MCS4225184.1 putative short-subunit dehydrogenase-like oxidoreductase (DUF2520 family) [Sphingobacterium sp. BIGb0165]
MNIVILGSGNAATHFGQAFQELGHRIVQIYSKTKANADALAFALHCPSTDQLSQLQRDADLYLIAVSDQAIPTLVETIPQDLNGIVVHCSGATDLNVLERFKNAGVIYPPQSLSKNKIIDFSAIPFCVEGNNEGNTTVLLQLAHTFSTRSIYCNSKQRLAIHLSSVMVNNFSNILYQFAHELLEEHNLSFDLVRPIILETAEKVQNHVPITVQTGPAIRGDEATQQKHLKFISNKPDLQQIYQLLSRQITKRK